MLTESSNEATDAMVALLHVLFARQLLGTRRLANTRADGGWRNSDGAGVGRLQMTAWDTVRLLWRLQDAPAPWLAAGAPPMLSATSRRRLMDWLAAQQLNQLLSSASIRHVPGWQAGIGGRFAHKTGSTETYAGDAGRVELPGGGYFLIANLSSLGQCSAPHPDCATDWSVPRLGAAVERWLLEQLA